MSMIEYPKLRETVSHRTLSNGLEVIVVHKPFHARHYAFFATRYGGMDLRFEQNGQWQDTPAGIAHYLEHKMFDTENGSVTQELAGNGAVDNAFTSNSMTGYYFECTEKFYESLDILLRFVSTPYFTEESVAREQGIIAQEIRMTDDDPEWRVFKNLLDCLYETSPVRVPVAGTEESISHITPQLLYDCHRVFYTPSNMVLVCVGNIELDAVCEAAEAILPKKCGGTIRRDYGTDEGLIPVKRESVLEMEIAMPMFLTGFKCAAVPQGETLLRENIIGDMACDILFGDSSPLYNRLYEEGHINGSLGGSYDVLPGVSYLYVGGDAKNPHFVTEEIVKEAQRLSAEGIDDTFYRQIRRATYGQMLRSLNSFENIAVSMAEGHFRGFDFYNFPEIFDSVTKADVEEFLRKNINPEHAAISIIRPSGAEKEN